MKMCVTRMSGVQFEHEGLTLSCAIGPGTYSGNHDVDFDIDALKKGKVAAPFTATMEVAIIPVGKGLQEIPTGDTVAGYVPVDRLPSLLSVLCAPNPIEERTGALLNLLSIE